MFCKKCGKEIKDNDKFCLHCGCAIETNTTHGKSSSSKIIPFTVLGVIVLIISSVFLINIISYELDPKAYEIKEFISNATSVQYNEDDYYNYINYFDDKPEYCTNIELMRDKPLRTKCSADIERLKAFRHCYQDRSIAKVFGRQGQAAIGFAEMAEFNGVEDPKYAAEIGFFTTCEFKIRGIYSKTQKNIKEDISDLNERVKEAKEQGVSVTCYFDYLKHTDRKDITTCSIKDINKLDENFKTKRDEKGDIIDNSNETDPYNWNEGSVADRYLDNNDSQQTNTDIKQEQKQVFVKQEQQPVKRQEVNNTQEHQPPVTTQEKNQDVEDFMN